MLFRLLRTGRLLTLVYNEHVFLFDQYVAAAFIARGFCVDRWHQKTVSQTRFRGGRRSLPGNA